MGTREQKPEVKLVKIKMEFYLNSHQLQKPPKLAKYDVDPKIDEDIEETEDEQIEVQFRSEKGDTSFPAFSVPKSVTNDKLKLLLQAFKKSCPSSDDEDEEDILDVPYLFFLNGHEIQSSIAECAKLQILDTEKTLPIVYQPQAVFKVRPVSRCTSSMPGHTKEVLVAPFSTSGRFLASGSGDATVRFWDLTTETPHFECKGHPGWVLALAWAPNDSKLASGDKSGKVIVWDPKTGKQIGCTMTRHTKFITVLGKCLLSLTSHTMSVKCLKWGGSGLIYSASQDRTIKVWRTTDGALCRTLQGHGHWVNVLALNTDYVMRTAAFEPSKAQIVHEVQVRNENEQKIEALKRYDNVLKNIGEELMVSGADDFQLILWNPSTEKKPLAHMTGHQQLVNDVKFSPDARLIASASFDKSVRLWNGKTGN